MFNKDVFRLLHCEKFPIVNSNDALFAIRAINFFDVKSEPYPHSVVAHLLSISSRFIPVSELEENLYKCVKRGWRPYRKDATYNEQLCIKKICAIIDKHYNRKNEEKGGVNYGKTKKRKKSKA